MPIGIFIGQDVLLFLLETILDICEHEYDVSVTHI